MELIKHYAMKRKSRWCNMKVVKVSDSKQVTSETGRPNVFPKSDALIVSSEPRRGAPTMK